ncbi:hypothetical protein CQS04_04045 [Chryseomicrobium excrementi]|uniref:Glycosyl hydrolase family 13 catalytic domain-containing protein n=1 Tax=Chryseomicrobium excrementi TaxID=2041346 RepID=A0A2M9F3N0_9BACL|nr:alpha-amylase family glycosyl hydrolase [Chryseomicrobium excrementi]PJK18059.1 hypothetical protein CQS04_04045 [Chryseomicrobium excrementi]
MRKSIGLLLLLTMLWSIPAPALASMQGESVYDLLVDRYFNQTSQNDEDVNTQDSTAFAGGDFLGISDRLEHIQKMGFTYISTGPIFETNRYDGSDITNYEVIESRFGTEEEFNQLLEELHSRDMKLMIDLPLAGVGQEDLDDMKSFLDTYAVDGVKLTGLAQADESLIQPFIEEINTDELDVIALEDTDLQLDASFTQQTVEAFQNAFKTVDQPVDALLEFSNDDILALDTLLSERFTYFSTEENMFPPTRVKVALGALLTLPGVPVVTYGTEIAMNGTSKETSHQIMNFRVDEDIMVFAEDLQTIRNQSSALQQGDFELLTSEDGYMVFKRSSEDETFIVVINNSSETKAFNVKEELVGEGKELRGLFGRDIVRQDENGEYKLTVDRELVELYHVKEDQGLNVAYIAAMIVAYVLFLGFIYLVWRKGKQKKLQEQQ